MVPMMGNLNEALIALASIVGLVIVIAAWVVAAAALHERRQRKTRLSAIEQHLADAAEQSPAPTK